MTNWVIFKLDVSRIRFSVFDGENSDKLAHFLTNSDQNSHKFGHQNAKNSHRDFKNSHGSHDFKEFSSNFLQKH